MFLLILCSHLTWGKAKNTLVDSRGCARVKWKFSMKMLIIFWNLLILLITTALKNILSKAILSAVVTRASKPVFFFFENREPEIFQNSWNSKPFSRRNKHHDTISILGLKQATSTLSNAPSTISIRHPQLARSAPKVASWMQNSKFWKSRFLNFLIRPIESSVQKEISSHPYCQIIL